MILEWYTVIYFLWFKHTSKQAIPSELEEIYGNDMVMLWDVEKWIATFDSWHTGLADLVRSGRLRDIGEVDTVRALMESEEYPSQKKIAQMLGIYHEIVKHILCNNLKMWILNFKWVLYMLECCLQATQVEVS
jgi:hypothetical protein